MGTHYCVPTINVLGNNNNEIFFFHEFFSFITEKISVYSIDVSLKSQLRDPEQLSFEC